jgi:hypothetical protein
MFLANEKLAKGVSERKSLHQKTSTVKKTKEH